MSIRLTQEEMENVRKLAKEFFEGFFPKRHPTLIKLCNETLGLLSHIESLEEENNRLSKALTDIANDSGGPRGYSNVSVVSMLDKVNKTSREALNDR